jgi:Cys-rich repeat protein
MGVTINNSGNIGGKVTVNQDATCLSFIGGSTAGPSGPNGGGGGNSGGESGPSGTNGGGGNGGSTGSGPVNPPVTFRCSKDSDCASGQVCNTETSVCEKSGPNWLAIGLGIGGGLLLLAILIGIIVYFTRKR